MIAFFLRPPTVSTCDNKQQGSALLMALFIIIVLMLLGGALMGVLSTSSEAIAQEVIGTRAYMAANSAMQAELQKLFPLNAAPAQCDANNAYDFSSAPTKVDGRYHLKSQTTFQLYSTLP